MTNRHCKNLVRKRRTSTSIIATLLLFSPAASAFLNSHSRHPSGPIEDASCDVQQVEDANDSQLYAILQELRNTEFFRKFAVDLDPVCPLRNFGKKKVTEKKVTQKKAEGFSTLPFSSAVENTSDATDENEGEMCAGDVPDLDEGVGACDVAGGGGFGGFGGGGAPWQQGSTAGGFTATQTKFGTEKSLVDISSQESPQQDTDKHEKEEYVEKEYLEEENDEDLAEEDFECESDQEEMDLDAEPLCDLQTEDFLPVSPMRDLLSSALQSIRDSLGWESESQRDTFSWADPSDPIVSDSGETPGVPCDDPSDHVFWMDMCSEIKSGPGVQVVNLALNPERNTGYNGTHIWNAIYEENCIDLDGRGDAPMCYEERVLYRLLSGLHTSTTLSIATSFYPPSERKKRVNYEPNPQYFQDHLGNKPEYVTNLHFSYVVLLRALRKASSFLMKYEIHTGNIVEDEKASVLLKRLADTHILKSCNDVFSAFDESLMFQETSQKPDFVDTETEVVSLRQNFKGVFHNISAILDCVQCQQCKLHGKMAMLGYGTALKILFLPEEFYDTSLNRNEIVAFVNTLAKFSESMKEVRELTHLYWEMQTDKNGGGMPSLTPTSTLVLNTETIPEQPSFGDTRLDLLDVTVGILSKLAQDGKITDTREAELIRLALQGDTSLLILAKHYQSNLDKFLLHSQTVGNPVTEQQQQQHPDAIVVGAGLAGLAATLNILDRGGTVYLLDKEHRLGGNSAKASSGINAYTDTTVYNDTLSSFQSDTLRSAGDAAQPILIETLVKNSASAVHWLQDRAKVDLSLVAQLGGHSYKRTHRPNNGMVGAEVIYAMQREVKKYEITKRLRIYTDTKVTKLMKNDRGHVIGVHYHTLDWVADDSNAISGGGNFSTPNVILTTGGFASDRNTGSYLDKTRPELMRFPATAGLFSTGDGISLATELGAGTVDMDKIQIHPTGWVNPSDPKNPNKVLAAELMRGVGGILLNDEGVRFCNELGTRSYVTDKMLLHDVNYAKTKKWDTSNEVPAFSLVLSSAAALDGKKHVDLYSHKGLLTKLEGIDALSQWMNLPVDVVREFIEQYKLDAVNNSDSFGKASFRNIFSDNLEVEIFYAGKVTPVLHYCMGGITIDEKGRVLDESRSVIQGLYAAGETAGGVHGNNRLGGNSLLECTVYGTIIGQNIPIQKIIPSSYNTYNNVSVTNDKHNNNKEQIIISSSELSKHNTPEDCWVAIHGSVYDLTEFAEEHPPGAESIYKLGGTDGTEAFDAVHNQAMLDDFDDVKVGIFS